MVFSLIDTSSFSDTSISIPIALATAGLAYLTAELMGDRKEQSSADDHTKEKAPQKDNVEINDAKSPCAENIAKAAETKLQNAVASKSTKDKKKKQKAKKAGKKSMASKLGENDQKACVLSTNLANDATVADGNSEDGWDLVVGKKSKELSNLTPSVAALFCRKESLEVSSRIPTSAESAPPKAAPLVADTVSVQASAYWEGVEVSTSKLGMIIGTAGATINMIHSLTGANIEVPDASYRAAKSTAIIITGADAASVQAAKGIVADLCSKGYSPVLERQAALASGGDQQDQRKHPFVEINVKVPIAQLHEVIGKGGAVIGCLQQGLGVKIHVPDTKEVGATKKRVIKLTVAGIAPRVDEARAAIRSIVQHHHHALTHPGVTHGEVGGVPASMYRAVIGQRGSTIKHIQNSYQVRVFIPESPNHASNITIVGSASGVHRARTHIQRVVQKAEQEQEQQYASSSSSAGGDGDGDDYDEIHESWMDEYAPPARQGGMQWA